MSAYIQAIRNIIADLNNPVINTFYEYNPYPYDVIGSDIYIDRINNIFAAGKKLIEERVLLDHQKAALDIILKLKKDAHSQLKSLNPDNDEDHHLALDIITESTKQIAEVLRDIELNHFLKNQGDAFIDDWLVELQDRDYALISTTKRKPIVNIYPDGQGGHMVSIAKPLSNISSLSRKGEPAELPNFWKSTSIHLDKDGNVISKREVYRSASLSPFEENNRVKRLSKSKEIAKFEMRQYAMERVLELPKNANKEELLKALSFDFFNLSIQSTIYAEKRSIKEGFNTYQEIQKMANDGQLSFSSEQIALIKKKFPQLGLKDSDFKIKPQIIFMNLGTNMMRGDDPQGYQAKINKAAKIELQKRVMNKLKHVHEVVGILGQKNPIDKESLKMIDDFIDRNKTNDKLNEEINTLRIFSNYAHFNRKGQKTALEDHTRNKSKNNYLQQESVIALAEHLGIVVKANCQSGKDRTGMLFASVEAAQIQRDRQQQPGAINKNEFWERHLPNCVNHTTGREITTVNCPGAKGLQGMTYELIVPGGFRDAIHAKMQDRASRLHKAPYVRNKGKVSNVKGKSTHSHVSVEASHFDSPVLKYKEVVEHLKSIQDPKAASISHSQKTQSKLNTSVEVLTQEKSAVKELNDFLVKPGINNRYNLWSLYQQKENPNVLSLDVGENPFKLTKVTIEEVKEQKQSNLKYSFAKTMDNDRKSFAMETICRIAVDTAKTNAVITLPANHLDEIAKLLLFKAIQASGRDDLIIKTSKGEIVSFENIASGYKGRPSP